MRMPNIGADARAAVDAAKAGEQGLGRDVAGEFDRFSESLGHLLHHHHAAPEAATQTPASTPASTTPTPKGTTSMSISSIAGDIKTAVENADQWVKEVTDNHLPAIVAQAQKYESSPVVQALEAVLLPPDVEQQIANMITAMGKAFPAAQATAPVTTPAAGQGTSQTATAAQPVGLAVQ